MSSNPQITQKAVPSRFDARCSTHSSSLAAYRKEPPSISSSTHEELGLLLVFPEGSNTGP